MVTPDRWNKLSAAQQEEFRRLMPALQRDLKAHDFTVGWGFSDYCSVVEVEPGVYTLGYEDKVFSELRSADKLVIETLLLDAVMNLGR